MNEISGKYQAIIYDFDGVIVDSVAVKSQAFAELYRPYGDEIMKKVVAYHLAYGGLSRYKKIRYFHQTYLGRKVAETELQQLGAKFSRLVLDEVLQARYIDGAREFLADYHREMDFYVCTGTPEQEILEIVERRDLKRFFKAVYGSPALKPAIIRRILTENTYTPENVLFVGDATTDYAAAEETGLPFVGIKSPAIAFPDGTVVLDNLHQLRAIVDPE